MALMFDGQIGNAAPRIQLIGAGKRIRRADIETGGAAPAIIFFARIGLQIERGVDFAKEQPRSVRARHQIGVLALPADAGAHRQRFFHHRCGIDEDLYLGPEPFMHPARDPLQALLEDIVIVTALGVDRDRAPVGPVENIERRAGRAVIHPQHDDRARIRP